MEYTPIRRAHDGAEGAQGVPCSRRRCPSCDARCWQDTATASAKPRHEPTNPTLTCAPAELSKRSRLPRRDTNRGSRKKRKQRSTDTSSLPARPPWASFSGARIQGIAHERARARNMMLIGTPTPLKLGSIGIGEEHQAAVVCSQLLGEHGAAERVMASVSRRATPP
nr:unnamed protein product [Digitaria exilis]